MRQRKHFWLVSLLMAMLAIPVVLGASSFPITLPNPTGSPLNFSGNTFTLGNCTGTSDNTCTLDGGPSGALGISWNVESIIPSPPYSFTLNSNGTISNNGALTGFDFTDNMGDYITGNLEWTTWQGIVGGDTFLNAAIQTTQFGVSSAPGEALLGTPPGLPYYYLQLNSSCGTAACVTFSDPAGAIVSASFSSTPFGSVETPEPRMIGLLACALATLPLLRRNQGKRRGSEYTLNMLRSRPRQFR